MTTSTYIHGTSEDEQARLSRMNDVLLNQASLREMALRGDEQIVDFGAGLGQFTRAMGRVVRGRGRVIGIERDEAQLAAARRLAERDGETDLVELVQGDVLEVSFGGQLDLAHARFVLEHVADPARVVRNMVASVRSGGRIVLADDDHDTLRLWPEPPGFADLWRAYIRSYDRNGTDPFVGRRLVALLHQAGAQPVRNSFIFFGGCAGMSYFNVLAANMIGVVVTAREAMLAAGLTEARTFDETVAAAREWARRPDAAVWFAMCWAEGVKP